MTLFITFEGGEGCGKSTQTRALHKKLKSLRVPSILVREPGGTALGERVRHLLKKSTDIPVSALTELILFNASRSQLLEEVILPNLKSGNVVICDRFTDSTIAYQSCGRGLDSRTVEEMNLLATRGLKPSITFLLDVPPEVGLARKKARAGDRFENEQLAFHQRVRQGFLNLAAKEPRRWVVIDAALPKNAIFNLIWQQVSRHLAV